MGSFPSSNKDPLQEDANVLTEVIRMVSLMNPRQRRKELRRLRRIVSRTKDDDLESSQLSDSRISNRDDEDSDVCIEEEDPAYIDDEKYKK